MNTIKAEISNNDSYIKNKKNFRRVTIYNNIIECPACLGIIEKLNSKKFNLVEHFYCCWCGIKLKLPKEIK